MKCRGKSDQCGADCIYCGLLMDSCDGHDDYAFNDNGQWLHIDELNKEDEMSKENIDKLTEITKPLIKYLNENYHPHVTVIVTPTSVELLEGLMSNPKIHDYLGE